MKTSEIEDIYELSPVQQGMLFHTLGAATTETQFQQFNCILRGVLDRPAFERAWQRLVDREPVLRTLFVWQDMPQPVQVVRSKVTMPLRYHDWRDVSPDEQHRRVEDLLQQDRTQGFDLAQAPLMRLTLIRLTEDTHRFIWSRHHIVLDGWSIAVLLRDVFAIYAAFVRGNEPALPPVSPYRNYIAWLKQQPVDAAETFWRQQLAGYSGSSPLRIVVPHTTRPDMIAEYGEQTVYLSPAATNALQSLARRRRLTLSTLMQGAWALTLHRLSGATDIVFGATVAGRPPDLAGVESMVGLFINTLPVRLRVPAADQPVLPWLAHIQDQHAALRQYEHISLADIQRWSTLPAGLPLFESIVVVENYPVDQALEDQDDLRFEQLTMVGARTNYPLTLLVLPDRQFGLRMIYDLRRFDQGVITRILSEMQTMLEYIATEPSRMLAAEMSPHSSPSDDTGAADQQREQPERTSAYIAPRTPIEHKLAAIWGTLLGVEQVGINDRFFDLGGHSLLATQIQAQVHDAFQVMLPLHHLFESPTVAGLAAAIARHKADAQNDPVASTLPVIAPDPALRYEPFPLTDIQQAYWVGRRGAYELGNVASHSYLEFESDTLDLERFAQAVRQLIARHDMLRAIVRPDGQQQVLEHVPPYEIVVSDLRGLPSEDATAQIEATRHELSHQVLRTDQWPLFDIRASLLDRQRVRLHISTDAIIRDAWSVQILVRELLRLYHDRETTLPPLDLRFRDYVLAERASHTTELYQRAQRYWRERLATLPPAPSLPLSQNPALLQQPRFERHSATLEPEAWACLKRRAAQAGLTPSGVLLAAFAEVLRTWSSSPRLTINLTLFNRLPLHPQVNEIVGDFTATTLLAVEHTLSDPFEVRARRIQEQLWADLDHRYVGGVWVARELARARGGAAHASMPVVFTSTLTQRTSGQTDLPLHELGTLVYSITQTPQVWLDHQVAERDGALVFNWDAVADLFPAGLLHDMFESYQRLLHGLADGDELWQSTAQYLLPPAQLAQRSDLNRTAAPHSEQMLHTLFAAMVPLRPLHPAVIAPDKTLSYEELHLRSRHLGRRLRELGARPNTLVAVAMEKGWQQIVAVLAVLQAGAAYLPIDPHLPAERFRYMLEHGQVALALTQASLDTRHWPDTVQHLVVDAHDEPLHADPVLEPGQSADDLAYVIYTSGSTGQPKGVMITHRAAVNTILDINRRFDVGPDDRVLALSSLSFDLSVYDIFGALAAGGTIVMPDSRRDPAVWLATIAREQVTIWDSVPALMQLLTDHAATHSRRLPDSLRLVLLSGDWIPVTLPAQIAALAEQAQVISLGGATEAAIWSILYPIEHVDPSWKSIPYGAPMRNQQFHVLDAALNPCPVWVPGALYIGGMGLALGYWRDPEKTREHFIMHPATGERLYRTGDLGRYLPDGNIEFLGRADFQVKVQGYRIELGEIEAALMQHARVRAAVVTATGERHEAKRLIAYVVPDAASDAAADAPDDEAVRSSIERVAFKLKQPGLRADLDQQPGVQFERPAADRQPERFQMRRSRRAYLPAPIPLTQLGALLSCLSQIEHNGLPKYRYGSAGGLYPVQVYVYIKPGGVVGIAGGAYYYHPRDHRLVLLSSEAALDPAWYAPVNRPIFESAGFALFLVGQMSGIAPVYDAWARDFCMLEAGLITQLLETAAPDCEIGLCQIGGFDFAPVRPLFALEDSHLYLHSLVGGLLDPAEAQRGELPSVPSRAGAAGGGSALVEELRGFVQQKLPEYMLPSAFVLLDALPLSGNGKVDRAALPKPDATARDQGERHVLPQNEIERTIAAIVEEVLQIEQVGVHDNFFDLGGTSVHLVQVHTRLQRTFSDIPLVDLLKYPTVRALATALGSQREQEPAPQLDQRVGRKQDAITRQQQIRKRIR